jgi:hypothetical protein
MATALFKDLMGFGKGDKVTFHYQELNPPDLSKAMLLEVEWAHDHIDGDLAFGSMIIPGLGFFEVDAYIYGGWAVGRPNGRETAWLSRLNVQAVMEGAALRRLTGGPLRTTEFLPSEISTRSGPREEFLNSTVPRVVCFSREEQATILNWQRGMAEKGFKCDFPDETYVEYKRALWHSLSSDVEKSGLNGHIEVRRLRHGLFSTSYSLSASDDSFRNARSNPKIKTASPSFTRYLYEDCSSFGELLKLMDQAVDMLVQRNNRHMRDWDS